MRVGDIVISNDLLGVIVSKGKGTCDIKDEYGIVRTINKDSMSVVVDSYALAARFYVGLARRVVR